MAGPIGTERLQEWKYVCTFGNTIKEGAEAAPLKRRFSQGWEGGKGGGGRGENISIRSSRRRRRLRRNDNGALDSIDSPKFEIRFCLLAPNCQRNSTAFIFNKNRHDPIEN